MMTFAQAMAYVEGFSHSGAPVRDLSRIGGLMERLENPQNRLQFIHIAGTNGKGSAAEYLTNILMESGFRTGTFTSPYIRHYRDRIRLNREDIPEEAVCAACERVAAAAGDKPYSQFEITFAIAMLYFVQAGAEIVVLETGLGGLLDCTNIIEPPLCCVITSISLDHTAILGDTVEGIAAHKAGIIKHGSDVVLSPDNLFPVIELVRDTAAERQCPFRLAEMSEAVTLSCTPEGTHFLYQGYEYRTVMGGRHQITNALTVIQTVEVLRERGFTIPEEAVQKGLAETKIPGRIQIIGSEPLVILDGGHNRDGIDALCSVLDDARSGSFIVVIGMTHRDAAPYAARKISALAEQVFCVDGFTENAMPAEALAALFPEGKARTIPLEIALMTARAWATAHHGGVVICGSLYLASWYLTQEEA